ncbi:MAG: hypothetical protein NC548_65750 [Lachnospiraceae bacterium]|nr:hypothetical protein [Lachnospiraceae bacterium]
MKKLILSLEITAVFLAFPTVAHAAEMLEKDYIKAEIWEEIWLGKSDNGTEFPESSYKHHLLEKWVDENYGDDDYDWTAIGELKYSYKNYYKNLTENWDFNDDNGIWTIETEDNFYSFQLIDNQWNMLDENGSIVDIFPIFSTIAEEKTEIKIEENGNNSPRVIGNVTRTETPSDSPVDSDNEFTSETIENAVEIDVRRSESSPVPFVIGGLVIVVSGTVFMMHKKRK